MLVTRDTFHLEMSPLNDVQPRNIYCMTVTLDTSQFEMSMLNDDAPENMNPMLVTRDTSHFEMSLLKVFWPENKPDISVTSDTSHDPIAPNGPSVQSPTADSLMHAATAAMSSVLEPGRNTVVLDLHVNLLAKPLRSAVHSQSCPLA
jgi:hypothetical protein